MMECAGIVGETRGCGRRRPSGLQGDEYTDHTGHARLIFSPNLNPPDSAVDSVFCARRGGGGAAQGRRLNAGAPGS
jgi:hypothetical protein